MKSYKKKKNKNSWFYNIFKYIFFSQALNINETFESSVITPFFKPTAKYFDFLQKSLKKLHLRENNFCWKASAI